MSYGIDAWVPCEMNLEATIPVKIKMEPIQLIREFAKAMKYESVFDKDFDLKYKVIVDTTHSSKIVVYRDTLPDIKIYDECGYLYDAIMKLLNAL